MCGIFGSDDAKKFNTLYRLNCERGNFSYGVLYHNNLSGNYIINKHPGIVPADLLLDGPRGFRMLGHTQAPTSTMRGWSEETSHPFEFKNWIVAHNGILNNFEEIKQKYFTSYNNPVDSSIIPRLLDYCETQHSSIVTMIRDVAEILKGTFGCWIYHIPSSRVFLIRCSSTIFADIEGNFSSVRFENSELLEEGWVYEVVGESIITRSRFEFDSPFFTL